MKKRGRLLIVLLVAVVCGIFLFPTVKWYAFVPQETKDIATGSKIQIRELAQGQASRDLRTLKEVFADDPKASVPSQYSYLIDVAKDGYKNMKKDSPRSWTVEDLFKGFYTEKDLFDTIENRYRSDFLDLKTLSGKILQLGLDLRGGMSILLEADSASYEAKNGTTLSSAKKGDLILEDIAILNERIDQFGVSEPNIRKQGSDQILIEVPGAADPERINSFLRGKGSLTFQIVDEDFTSQLNTYFAENPSEVFTDKGELLQPEFLPAGKMATAYYVNDAYGLDELASYVVLDEEIGLDGIHIANAMVGSNSITGQPTVNFELDAKGGELFYKLTSTHTGERMAVVQDGKVKAMATITEGIRNNVQITGFGQAEAQDLSIVLKTAALPIELIVVSQQAVGASLGEDTVRAGLIAILVGLSLVFIFMVIIYKGSGLIADVALLFNLVILISVLSAFNLTLTLTSIAGLVLTVGMAVDANVIILERIKEELQVGKNAHASVKAGFQKAFWTIMDANVTTIIAALVLSQLGSGAIKGFANTLAVGIISSMFSALFVVKLMYDAYLSKKDPTLSISWRRK